MKHVEPPCGETPLSPDELEALLPDARYVLGGDTINKLAVYDFEQAIQDDVAQHLVADGLSGEIALATLLSDYFVRDLHARLYGEIWSWAGLFRRAHRRRWPPPRCSLMRDPQPLSRYPLSADAAPRRRRGSDG